MIQSLPTSVGGAHVHSHLWRKMYIMSSLKEANRKRLVYAHKVDGGEPLEHLIRIQRFCVRLSNSKTIGAEIGSRKLYYLRAMVVPEHPVMVKRWARVVQ